MKKMNKIIAFGTGILLALLAGCSDLNDTKSTSSEENSKYVVKGTLSMGSKTGAAPNAFVSSKNAARTATASFADDFEWKITANKGSTEYSPSNYDSGSEFTFLFEEGGEYTIEATASKCGTVIASGSEKVTLSDASSVSVNITAEAKYSTVLGSVNLEMNFDKKAAERVKEVEVYWRGHGEMAMLTRDALGYDREATMQSEETAAAMQALDEWEEQYTDGALDKTIPVSNGKATLSLDDIFCGAHTVEFIFCDSYGNTVYSCKEIVNVYSGFTTDTWYGSAPYIKNGTFNLTWDAISAYGVAKDNTVLYSSTDGYRNTNGDLILTADSTTFDFDLLGCVWAFTNWGTTDVEIVTDSLVRSENLQVSTIEMKMLSELKIDRSNDVLYTCFTESGSENTLILTKYDNLIKDGDGETYTEYRITFTGYVNFSCQKVVINGDNVYVLGVFDNDGTNEYYLMTADLTTASDDKIIETNTTGIALNLNTALPGLYGGSIIFTDMIYQEGYVYILASDNVNSLENDHYYNSRGAIIRVHPGEENVDARGWTEDCLGKTDTNLYAGWYGQMLFTEKQTEGNIDLSKAIKFSFDDFSENFYEFYSPIYSEDSANPTEAFYGPRKFIAIKPKKLVIADSGVAFYTDSNDAWCFKNVNRVIEIDLGTFAMTSIEDISFNFTYATSGRINTCSFTTLVSLPEEFLPEQFYTEHGSDYYLRETFKEENQPISIAIPCGDERILDRN